MPAFDVIIIGAGIIGCACARECAQAGMRVAIIEQEGVAVASTGAAMGHIVVMEDSPAQLALTRYARTLWDELSSQLPSSVEHQAPGTIWIASDDAEMREVHAKHNTLAAFGLSSTILDAAALAKAEPNLRTNLAGALHVPGDAVIDPSAAARFFLAAAKSKGATFLQSNSVIRIYEDTIRLTSGDRYAAGRIILATGTSTNLLPWLPLQKRKGHLVLTEPRPGFVHHQLVELSYVKSTRALGEDSVAFNIQPRQNGQLLIGSSRQYRDQDSVIDPNILTRMLERAHAYMPTLATIPHVRSWTGFRAATPDKLPLIGATIENPLLYLAVGFEGLGITSSPVAGRLIADHLLQRTSSIDPTPYLPARFSNTSASQETL